MAQIGLWMRKIVASTVLGLLWMYPVLAQEDLLTRAEIYKLILELGCDRLLNYLKSYPNLQPSDRAICS